MNDITNAERKIDIHERSMRLLFFLQKIEAERNPELTRTDLRKTIYSNLNRLSGSWNFIKENSLGYKLHSNSHYQINNKSSPESVELSLTAPIIDEKHLKDILVSARVDAIKDGVNLQIDKNTPEFNKYVSVVGLVNNPIILPISPSELDELYNISHNNIKLADEKKGKIIKDPNNKKKVIFDPEALFQIYDFMQNKELETQTTDKDVLKFDMGENVKNLGNISYSIDNNNAKYFDLVISGTKEQIRNLISIPRFNEEKSFGFNPKKSSIEFTGMPQNISPTEMSDILDGIPGDKKTIRVILDENNKTYKKDCEYINNLYKELMIVNPDKYTLEIYDNYGINGNLEVFTNTHGPGAAYDSEISNRPQFKHQDEENDKKLSF